MSANTADGDSNPEKTFFENRFHRLAESDINSDCEFLVGPKKTIIRGHKVIFSAASDVFQAMFCGELKENTPVKVEDLSAEGFKGMKTFIYAGDITFTSSIHALLTYIAARKYLVPQLSNVCTKFIEEKLQPVEVLEFCDICLNNCITEFEDLCTKIIQEKTDEVVDSEYFTMAECETIELILKSPSLKLNSEIELFDHFERWALAEVERRQISEDNIASSFDRLKKHIRFLTVKGDEFVSRVGESKLLTHDEKHAIAFNHIKYPSKPVPDSISLIREPRDFKLLPSEYHQSSHRFIIPIDKDKSSITEYIVIFNTPTNHSSQFSIFSDYRYGFIHFRLETIYNCVKAVFIIKSKFRVLAEDKWNNFEFENEYKDFVDATNTTIKRTIYLAMIPITKLQNSHFLKSISNKVFNIEGEFKIKKMDFE